MSLAQFGPVTFIITTDRARSMAFYADKLGIWASSGDEAWVAGFHDPDGNNLSLTQF